ncbi:MAG: hypothetical protein V1809_15080 [Planctomycetota bacterium]
MKPSAKIIIGGLAAYGFGMGLLTLVNRMADNWAGAVSPLLIVAGLVAIGWGLWKRAMEADVKGGPGGGDGSA